MNRTLAEEYLLLALDDSSGKPLVDSTKLHAAIAGAAVVELTLDGALEIAQQDGDVKKGRLRRTGANSPSDPLLREILDKAHGRKPKDAVSHIGVSAWRNRAGDLKDQLLLSMASQGVLREEKAKVLGIFPTTAWLPQDPSVEARIRARVHAALTGVGTPEPRTAALVSLLSATDIVHKVFPGEDKRAIRSRAKEISDSDWAGPAVKKSIDEMVAVMAAVVTTTVVAGSAGSS
jgi:hypothetical protein